MAQYRGTLVSFNSGTYRATVRLDGSAPQVLTNVHCTRLASAEFVADRRCLVDTGDHGDIDDAVVIAVWTP